MSRKIKKISGTFKGIENRNVTMEKEKKREKRKTLYSCAYTFFSCFFSLGRMIAIVIDNAK